MKITFLAAFFFIFNVLLAAVYGDDLNIEKRGIFSRNHRPRDVRRRNKQYIPPVVLPGIMHDYDPARVYNRGKRMFISELNSLENRFPYMDNVLSGKRDFVTFLNTVGRTKRSLMEGEQMIYVPQPMVHREKRDLRKLKRDLDYATGYGYPNYAINQSNRNYEQVPNPEYALSKEEMESLLQGIDVLEYLALLKQAGEVPSLGVPEKHHNIHSSPSRFAPQPRLFQEEELRNEDNGRFWGNKHLPQGKIVWSTEKRGGLSMVPGFKRSAFREAERMSPPQVPGHSSETELPDETFEKEYNNMKLRSVAM